MVVALFLVAALVPGVTTQVATFQIVNGFGMFDTLWAPIALYMGTDIVSIYIFLQFVRSIPISLDEAAALRAPAIHDLPKDHLAAPETGDRDGGDSQGDRRLQRLLHPVPLHAVAEDLGVISTSLFRFQGPFAAQWETISAGVIIVILPTLIAFLSCRGSSTTASPGGRRSSRSPDAVVRCLSGRTAPRASAFSRPRGNPGRLRARSTGT